MSKFDDAINKVYASIVNEQNPLRGPRSAIDAAANLAPDYETSKKEDGVVKAKVKDMVGGNVGSKAAKLTKDYNKAVIDKAEKQLKSMRSNENLDSSKLFNKLIKP